ncbi:MAG: hypothetical protein J6S14_14160 [Clostridia bacterium]|nr:hypothetical protein [Clostridia bacterium]
MNALKTRNNYLEDERKKEQEKILEKYLKKTVHKQIAEEVRRHSVALTSLFLWALYDATDQKWGKKRLLRVAERMQPCFDELVTHYEMGQDDLTWLCQHELQDYTGITPADIAEKLKVNYSVEVV